MGWKWLKGLILVVFGGRAWVSSLPNFFLGKYFQFWKLPPGLCINSRDNVYYPVFLGCIWYIVLTVEYTVNCIVSVPASVKTLSQNESFSLGKAHASVFSLPTYPQLHPLNHPQPLIYPQQPYNLVDNYTNTTTYNNLVISCTTTPRQHTTALNGSNITRDTTLFIINIVIL